MEEMDDMIDQPVEGHMEKIVMMNKVILTPDTIDLHQGVLISGLQQETMIIRLGLVQGKAILRTDMKGQAQDKVIQMTE